MTGVWTVLLLSLLPGAGNFAGGMVAELSSSRWLNWALHAAAGIVIAITLVSAGLEAVVGQGTASSEGGVDTPRWDP